MKKEKKPLIKKNNFVKWYTLSIGIIFFISNLVFLLVNGFVGANGGFFWSILLIIAGVGSSKNKKWGKIVAIIIFSLELIASAIALTFLTQGLPTISLLLLIIMIIVSIVGIILESISLTSK